MFKKASLFFILILLIACQDLNLAEKPKKLLTPDEMEAILTDMILLDAMISVNNFRIDNFNINVPDFVYNKYKIDSLTLSKNMEYYNEQYKENIEIYTNVKANIEELKQRLEYDKKLKDSLNKVKVEAERINDSIQKKKD